jgi:D-alanyl-D-alanine carboxypeptidase/D-alanyl-D-alanine-endopeptidase (penicillin-binding protein 4)
MQRALRFLFCVLLPLSSSAQQMGIPPPVQAALARAGIPESSIGLLVQAVDSDKPLAAHGPDRPLNPGSAMKALTTYAALELLGPAHVWNTEIYAEGALREEVLSGNLIIKGRGDPQLTLENFWVLLRSIRALGVRHIDGDVLLDRSHFGTEAHDPARFDDQPTRPYNTGPDALLVNFKAITVRFLPDSDARTLRAIAEPALPEVRILSNAVLADGPCGTDWLSHLKIDAQSDADSARLLVSGAYPAACGEQTRSFSLLSHRAYAASLFSLLWKELGGTLSGTVRDGIVGPSARLIAVGKSRALSEIVRDINKYSNNVMARQLFLTLGAPRGQAPATADRAREQIEHWLAQKKLSIPELVLENGAGLSRIERMSARSLARVLLSAYRSPLMPEFIASLPLVAVDGTMRKRLPGAPVAGHAHVKTGTLSGVRTIAGYVLDAQGRRSVVAFIVNHPNAARAQPAQDALLQWVYSRR